MPTKDSPEPAPAPSGDEAGILAALRLSPRSIDEIASRVGARTVREVRALAFTLRSMAEAGLVTAAGNGSWAAPGAKPGPREGILPEDVLAFGFGDGVGPLAFPRLRDNVVAGTGKDPGRLAEAMSLLVISGHIDLVGERSYVLTEKAVAERGPARLPALQSGVLDIVRQGPATVADVASRLGMSPRKARSMLADMHAVGLLERTRANPGWVYAAGNDRPLDPGAERRILMSGPAERRAIRLLYRPLSQSELGERLGVSRERARQIIHRLVERGLVRLLPPATPARGERHLYVSTLADAASAAA